MKKLSIYLLTAIMVISLFSCKENILNMDDYSHVSSQNEDIKTDIVITGDFAIDQTIPVPANFKVSQGNFTDKVVLNWDAVNYKGEKVRYHIYKSLDQKEYVRLTKNSPIEGVMFEEYISDDEIKGTEFFYSIRTVLQEKESNSLMSQSIKGYTLGIPTDFSATLRENVEKVTVSWQPVPGAEYYALMRAQLVNENSLPGPDDFEFINQAIEGFSFDDKSNLNYGTLKPNTIYAYKLIAYFSPSVSIESPLYKKGALLPVGAPGSVILTDVSNGIFSNAIRIQWEKSSDANAYKIYRFTESQYQNGENTGTPVIINPDLLITSTDGKSQVYYDMEVDDSMQKYFYRVAAQNDVGLGRLSAFSSADSRTLSTGSLLGSLNSVLPDVQLSAQGWLIRWPKVLSATGYFLYRYSAAYDPEFDRSTLTDAQWGDPAQYVEINPTESPAFIDEVTGDALFDEERFYKLLPVNAQAIQALSLSKDLSNLLSYKDEIETLNSTILAPTPLITGYSSESEIANDAFEIKPELIETFAASQDDDNYQDQIIVTAKFSQPVKLRDFYNMKLVRSCHYGYETGVYPMSEPNPGQSGERVSFTKKGTAIPEGIIEVDLVSSIDSVTGVVEYLDPMPDFKDGQLVPGSTLKWNYATWDREAWKDLKRQKAFDMHRAVKVKYTMIITNKQDASELIPAKEATGWPALSTLNVAYLGSWLKDCAFNRMTVIHVPRYCWGKTVGWLVGANQNVNGEVSGKVSLKVSGFNGSGNIVDYSDWPGFSVSFKDNSGNDKGVTMAVDPLKTFVPRELTIWSNFITPLYTGTVCIDRIRVRDYGYYWGLFYTTDNNGNFQDHRKTGNIYIWHKTRGKQRLSPDILIPIKGHLDSPGDYERNPFGYTRFDLGEEEYASFYNFMWSTRINFKYRGYPQDDSGYSAWQAEENPVLYWNFE